MQEIEVMPKQVQNHHLWHIQCKNMIKIAKNIYETTW